ncbi:MAG: hypothetical protein M3Z87_01180 [Lactobacillus sp.]|nr:hypothetical protein [Lactobacillus sp.]
MTDGLELNKNWKKVVQLANRNSRQASKNVALKRYSNVRPSLWLSALVKQAQARKSDFQNNKQLGRDRF